ncbi:SMI1/KNR4 family protein [Phenylobacterium sp.]|uniref:SMI1/KNR4 family protein n=1 Tax=Phenylobacterium sp. TaxID=1871053 RepID=UPI002F3F0110
MSRRRLRLARRSVAREPIEAELGTALPQDYKDFVRIYDEGEFMEFLGIHVPACRSPHVRFEAEVHAVQKALLDDEGLAYPLWPNPGGLIVFGKTDFGDYLFWLPHGPPENWRVVVWGRGLQKFETFDRDLTEFLAGLATGEILPEDFPEGMLPCDHLFRPSSEFPSATILPSVDAAK